MARKSQKARARKKNQSKNMSSHANRNVTTASSPPKVALGVAIAQLDLSSSGGPFARLPNELVQSILARLDIHELIHLQVVCKKWQAVVFLISQKKKSLYLAKYFEYQHGDNIKIFKERSFGLIDLKTFTNIELKFLNSDLPTQLNKLFPDIESLVLDMCSLWTGLIDFFPVLSQLHLNKLTTLSITFTGKSWNQTIVKLLTLINSFVSLKRLDICHDIQFARFLKCKISLLGPTLARLEQFSYSSYELSLVDLFGPNCSRVSLNGYFENINFSQWHSNNAQWLANVTHLELMNVQMEGHIDSLIVHAVSLQVLRFSAKWGSPIRMTPQMIGHLSKLKHFTEIEMNRIIFELPQLDRARRDFQLASLVSLRVCTLSIQELVRIPRIRGDVGKFSLATVLSAIFPNVEHLNIAISSFYFEDLQGILCYLGKFTKLQKHSFKEG